MLYEIYKYETNLYVFIYHYYYYWKRIQARMQIFEKRGANFRNVTKRAANLKIIPISRPRLGL